MSKEGFQGWVENIFLPHINKTPRKSDEPVLLVVDGHGSREQGSVMELFKANNVHVLVIPAHTSHILQPLDLGVNKVFKDQLAKYCREDVSAPEGLDMLRFRLFRHAVSAFYDASNKRHIFMAWRKSGMSPYDPTVVLDNPAAVNTLPPPEKPKRDAVSISGSFTTSPEKITALYKKEEQCKQKRLAKQVKEAQKTQDKKPSTRGPKTKITKASSRKVRAKSSE